MLVLVGNKSDLDDRRQVSTEEAEEYAKKREINYIETSARTGQNIKKLFNDLAKQLTGIETNPINPDGPVNDGIKLHEPKDEGAEGGEDGQGGKGKKKKCC